MQSTTAFLNNLSETVLHITKQVEELSQNYPPAALALRPSPERWSVLDNLEHLSLYGDFYLPLFEQTIEKGHQKHSKPRTAYRPGWLGNYLVQSMKPKEGRISNKMNTFKSKNPILTAVPANAMERFLEQQAQLISTLKKAANVDIQSLRISTTLGKFPKIQLGDGLAFVIGHEERHLLQIQQTLGVLKMKELA